MYDDTPYSVNFPVDASDKHRYACPSRRSRALGIGAKAINTAIECYEDTVGVDHTHCPDVFVTDCEFANCFLAGVLGRLLYRCRDLNVVSVASVKRENLDENSLTCLKVVGRIHHALVAQLTQRDEHLNPEQIHEDTRANGRYDSRLGNNALVEEASCLLLDIVVVQASNSRIVSSEMGHKDFIQAIIVFIGTSLTSSSSRVDNY